ncbi:MAG TPA: class II aldolase/adducin family protein [Chloroflexota bacterium]|jgi:ribulose-5-phosphate 4-epimerase/fuculose-1-phosphate aldolase
MSTESELREHLATCTRILAMEGLLGMFGHVSAYLPEQRRFLLCPGAGSDKARVTPGDLFVLDLDGNVLEGKGHVAVEWPIHAALHAARADALAVAHLHAHYTTQFAIARREFRPVTLQATLFGEGMPVYMEPDLVTTLEEGRRLAALIGDRRGALLRGHGCALAARSVEEMLYASLVLEDSCHKAVEAAALGELMTFSPEECRIFGTEEGIRGRAALMWRYFSRLESHWDCQPGTGLGPLA